MHSLIKFMLWFVPVRAWRQRIRKRARFAHGFRQWKKKFDGITDWKYEDVNGVTVASGTLADGNYIRLANMDSGVFGPELIAYEIFFNDDYHFSPGKDAIVIDIGMNIGFASLYYALRDDVEKIYAFEPMQSVYEKAKFGFQLNDCSHKVIPHNFGLGDGNKELTVALNKDDIGTSILQTDPSGIPIQIKDAADVIGKIIADHPGKRFVIKCDCEGAEQEIFRSLDKAHLLSAIDVIVMEYHYSQDDVVMPILDKNQFVYFRYLTALYKDKTKLGLIRAVRK